MVLACFISDSSCPDYGLFRFILKVRFSFLVRVLFSLLVLIFFMVVVLSISFCFLSIYIC